MKKQKKTAKPEGVTFEFTAPDLDSSDDSQYLSLMVDHAESDVNITVTKNTTLLHLPRSVYEEIARWVKWEEEQRLANPNERRTKKGSVVFVI